MSSSHQLGRVDDWSGRLCANAARSRRGGDHVELSGALHYRFTSFKDLSTGLLLAVFGNIGMICDTLFTSSRSSPGFRLGGGGPHAQFCADFSSLVDLPWVPSAAVRPSRTSARLWFFEEETYSPSQTSAHRPHVRQHIRGT